MLTVSLWVEGRGRLCADHRPHTETVGGKGTCAGDARDVGAGGHRRDLAMAQQLDLLARQAWGRARLVFGCILRGCANAQDQEKKNESEKNNKKKKKSENGLTGLNPHKNTDIHRPS